MNFAGAIIARSSAMKTPHPERSRNAIAARLRALLRALKISQAELCRRSGVNPTTLANWLSATNRPRLDEAIQLCDATGVTLDWLYLGKLDQLPYAMAQAIQAAVDNPDHPVAKKLMFTQRE